MRENQEAAKNVLELAKTAAKEKVNELKDVLKVQMHILHIGAYSTFRI